MLKGLWCEDPPYAVYPELVSGKGCSDGNKYLRAEGKSAEVQPSNYLFTIKVFVYFTSKLIV